jgi:hypothetical protein
VLVDKLTVKGRIGSRLSPYSRGAPSLAGRLGIILSPRASAGHFEARRTQPGGEASVERTFTSDEESGILALASKIEAAEAQSPLRFAPC